MKLIKLWWHSLINAVLDPKDDHRICRIGRERFCMCGYGMEVKGNDDA